MAKYRLPRRVKKEIQKRNRVLIEKYPFLFPRYAWTGKKVDDFDYSYNAIEGSIPQGWWKLFGIKLCEDLKNVCLENKVSLNDIIITDVKEKYGELRIYMSGYPETWEEHETAWEYISSHTCVKCGVFPVPTIDDGWVCPWCEECHTSENYNSLIIPDWDGRVLEYQVIKSYTPGNDDYKLTWIDMKPYYDKIGWKYNENNLILKAEIEESLRKEKEEAKALHSEFHNVIDETDVALALMRGDSIVPTIEDTEELDLSEIPSSADLETAATEELDFSELNN